MPKLYFSSDSVYMIVLVALRMNVRDANHSKSYLELQKDSGIPLSPPI